MSTSPVVAFVAPVTIFKLIPMKELSETWQRYWINLNVRPSIVREKFSVELIGNQLELAGVIVNHKLQLAAIISDFVETNISDGYIINPIQKGNTRAALQKAIDEIKPPAGVSVSNYASDLKAQMVADADDNFEPITVSNKKDFNKLPKGRDGLVYTSGDAVLTSEISYLANQAFNIIVDNYPEEKFRSLEQAIVYVFGETRGIQLASAK